MSTWLYDRDSRTVFDRETGDAVCVVSDLAEHDVMHRIGRMVAAAPDLRDASAAVVVWLSPNREEWPAGHPMHKLVRALMATIDGEVPA